MQQPAKSGILISPSSFHDKMLVGTADHAQVITAAVNSCVQMSMLCLEDAF